MHTSFKSYVIGFITCLVLTLAAYLAVTNHSPITLWLVTGLAVIQFIVQITFFLHLGQGKDKKENLLSLATAFGAMFLLIGGSLWIMKNLNYNMTPMQVQDSIMKDEGMMK